MTTPDACRGGPVRVTEHHDTTTPAAPAPAWWTAPAPPAWVLEQTRGATGWRNVGERRWQAVLPRLFAPDLLVLVNAAGTGFSRLALDLDDGGPDGPEWLAGITFADMQARFDYEELPGCIAPDCTDKGEARFVAAEIGHIAGRVVAAGEHLRMCRRHADDVFRAGTGGLDSVAPWLRPDAEILDPEYLLAAGYDGLSHDDLHRTRARLPRVLRDPREAR